MDNWLHDLVLTFLQDLPVRDTDEVTFRGARFDRGLAFPHFSVGAGGLGLTPAASREVERLFVEAGAADWSDRNIIGLGMAAPTIHEYGSTPQRKLLRPLFTGEEIWCQLFSEPEAGSDLASLRTSAVRDGDVWVVNGQKVWTTLAHVAKWGLLVARTDPAAPKHKGLTYFLLDMSLPGVEARPLRQLTGEAEFNEVFLADVRVPDEHRLGSAGEGWRVAMTTLMNERVSLPDIPGRAGDGPVRRAVEAYRDASSAGRNVKGYRDPLMRLWVDAEVVRLTGLRASEALTRGNPGPEGSIGKLAMAEMNKAIFDFVLNVLGSRALLIDDYRMTRPSSASVHGSVNPAKAFLRTRANSIEGGTSEILRNILAERVLGLPKEPVS